MMKIRHLFCFTTIILLIINLTVVTSSSIVSFVGVGTVAVIFGILYQRINEPIYTPEPYSLLNTNIVITGGNTGLGLISAKKLAYAGANVIVTVRNDIKGQETVQAVRQYVSDYGLTYQDQVVMYKVLQLDDIESMKQSVTTTWNDIPIPIHVLMNNAGVMALPHREITIDGYERQVQTNHIGHFLLTALLKDKLANDCHIINVSSYGHEIAKMTSKYGLDFDYMWKAEKGYNGLKSYGQSKLANIYFTNEIQRKSDESSDNNINWISTTLHPGAVATELGRNMVKNISILQSMLNTIYPILPKFGILKTTEQGASTQIWLATRTKNNDERKRIAGKYFINCKERQLKNFALNQTAAKRLWKDSEIISGIQFTIPHHKDL